MVEQVETGGLMKFDYSKGSRSKLSDKDKGEIADAYAAARDRKRIEKRNNVVKIVGIIIILILIGLGLIWL